MKGQIQTQIFVYIIALVVAGLILLFGYQAIKSFGERGEEVAAITFEKNLKATFDSIRTNYNKIEIKNIETPTNYQTLCFLDWKRWDTDVQPIISDSSGKEYLLLTEAAKEGHNAFLFRGIELISIDVGAVKADTNSNGNVDSYPGGDGYFLCVPVVQGKAKVKLYGKGDYVLVGKGNP